MENPIDTLIKENSGLDSPQVRTDHGAKKTVFIILFALVILGDILYLVFSFAAVRDTSYTVMWKSSELLAVAMSYITFLVNAIFIISFRKASALGLVYKRLYWSAACLLIISILFVFFIRT